FSPGGSIARGMYFTVTCSEGVPFITNDDILHETHGTYVGAERVTRHIKACQDWPKGDVPTSYINLVKSDLPALMIDGEVDGASAQCVEERAVKLLSNGRQIRIRYLGHQMDSACLRDIFKNFIAKASSKNVDSSCTDGIRRPAWATEMPPGFSLR